MARTSQGVTDPISESSSCCCLLIICSTAHMHCDISCREGNIHTDSCSCLVHTYISPILVLGHSRVFLNMNHRHHGRGPLLPSTNTGYGIGWAESQFTTLVSIYLSIVIQQTYYNTARATMPSHLVGERNTWSITVQTMKTGPIKTLQLTHQTH